MLLIQDKKEKIVIDLKQSGYKEIEDIARMIFSIAEELSLDPNLQMLIKKKVNVVSTRT